MLGNILLIKELMNYSKAIGIILRSFDLIQKSLQKIADIRFMNLLQRPGSSVFQRISKSLRLKLVFLFKAFSTNRQRLCETVGQAYNHGLFGFDSSSEYRNVQKKMFVPNQWGLKPSSIALRKQLHYLPVCGENGHLERCYRAVYFSEPLGYILERERNFIKNLQLILKNALTM